MFQHRGLFFDQINTRIFIKIKIMNKNVNFQDKMFKNNKMNNLKMKKKESYQFKGKK